MSEWILKNIHVSKFKAMNVIFFFLQSTSRFHLWTVNLQSDRLADVIKTSCNWNRRERRGGGGGGGGVLGVHPLWLHFPGIWPNLFFGGGGGGGVLDPGGGGGGVTRHITGYAPVSKKKASKGCASSAIYGVVDVFLKGEVSQTTMWIGWVENNFTKPIVKVWTDLDNPFKRSNYAKLCMSPSLDVTRPEYVISQEDNSPLTLYIDFQNFLDINNPFDPVHSWMHAHSSQP